MITKVKRTDSHQYLNSSPFHTYRCKKSILIVKHCILIKSVLKMTFFIFIVIVWKNDQPIEGKVKS